MDWISVAFEKTWFFAAVLIVGVLYGLGGLVHVGNILGFGERTWSEAPRSWKAGDIAWGTLDVIALVGIILRTPVGILAVVLAALSQIVAYGMFPNAFALTDEHRSSLRGMVRFHAVVLLVLGVLVYLAIAKSGV